MKILETHIADEKISKIRYFIELNGVETEGYLTLNTPMPVAMATSEDAVIKYVESDSQTFLNLIELNLQAQAQQSKITTDLPWQASTFTPGS
jgi:hypothetical protein